MFDIPTKKFQTKAGKLVYYKSTGINKDIVILFIHGLFGNKDWFTYYCKEYSLDDYSWIVPDLIGYGESEKPDKLDFYTMGNQGQYLYDLLRLEKVHNVIIMAHSMGGPIAISLIEKVKNLKNNIKIKGLFYLEGNLDKNDAFFSSTIAKYSFEQYKKEFDLRIENLIKKSKTPIFPEFFRLKTMRDLGPYSIWGSSYDLVKLSEGNQLLPRLQRLIDFPVYFVFGEKNKGKFTSETLVISAQLPIIYIPKAGHLLLFENPKDFWEIVKELIITNIL